MLIKVSKRYSNFDINDFFEEKDESLTSISTLELMVKHKCEVHLNLDALTNLKKFYIYADGECSLNLIGKAPLEILKMRGVKNCHDIHIHESSPIKILQLTECNLHAIPSWLYKLTKIETLELQRNKLTDLPIEFEWLKNLKRLNLDNNLFQDVPRVLANLCELNHLSCDANEIGQQKLRDFLQLLNS
ncbi:leucine-rich repeat domain-containing protein [Halobacteriovorax sp.]|uniref:leucine-rich repeat domain-containing protein n=1 Tax=Halobacteriovorax sp. TaxID=2020862 RepID=UPI003AF1E4C7